jgi:hypothetical protein
MARNGLYMSYNEKEEGMNERPLACAGTLPSWPMLPDTSVYALPQQLGSMFCGQVSMRRLAFLRRMRAMQRATLRACLSQLSARTNYCLTTLFLCW